MTTNGHENEASSKSVADDQTPASSPEPKSAEEITRHQFTDQEIDDLVARSRERDELFDRLQRTVADYENFKKRTRRERATDQDRFLVRFAAPFLDVLDDLRLALRAAEGEASGLVEGVRMIQAKFLDTLLGFSIKPFESEGEPFDPERHEAIQQVPDPSVPDKTVLQEIKSGFEFHHPDGETRVVRFAQVVVSQKPIETESGN